MPEGAVYVGRPTTFGNPFRVGIHRGPPIHAISPQQAADMYAAWIAGNFIIERITRSRLRGRDLVCWCPLDQPCHADVLLRIANEDPS